MKHSAMPCRDKSDKKRRHTGSRSGSRSPSAGRRRRRSPSPPFSGPRGFDRRMGPGAHQPHCLVISANGCAPPIEPLRRQLEKGYDVACQLHATLEWRCTRSHATAWCRRAALWPNGPLWRHADGAWAGARAGALWPGPSAGVGGAWSRVGWPWPGGPHGRPALRPLGRAPWPRHAPPRLARFRRPRARLWGRHAM